MLARPTGVHDWIIEDPQLVEAVVAELRKMHTREFPSFEELRRVAPEIAKW
jgi:hypothetical protein